MDCGNTRACAAPDINKHSKDKAHDRESTTKSSIAPPATASESAIRSRGPLRWNCRPDSAICSLWNGRRGHGRFKCRGVHQRCGAARGERVRSKEPSQRWNMHCKVVHREMAAVVARHELIAGEATAERFTRAIFSRTCPCFLALTLRQEATSPSRSSRGAVWVFPSHLSYRVESHRLDFVA